MSFLYEAIGRLVVSLVSKRYRDEIRLIGVATAVAVLFALLWGLRGSGSSSSSFADLVGSGSGRKRRSGTFVSIR